MHDLPCLRLDEWVLTQASTGETASGLACTLVCVGGVVGLVMLQKYLVAQKRKRLLQKYRDHDVVDMIMKKTIWIGATAEQTRDAMGLPLAIDRKVLKTKTTETWKYQSAGRNRFKLRIKLDDGVVVGWEDKS